MESLADNPWLAIPAADCEGPEGVGQLAILANLLGQELQPKRVLALGCATGNGFEKVDPAVTKHLMGVDLNPGWHTAAMDSGPAAAPDPSPPLGRGGIVLTHEVKNARLHRRPRCPRVGFLRSARGGAAAAW